MQIRNVIIGVLLGVCLFSEGWAVRFSVAVYNVENLFDADGVALYDQYKPSDNDGNPQYTSRELLNKLESITELVAAIPSGMEGQIGADIILFQEFELDRTPFDPKGDIDRFLAETESLTVEQLLLGDSVWKTAPVEWLMLKHLAESGLVGYEIARINPLLSEDWPAHHNVTFSRFPVEKVWQKDLMEARDLLVVQVEVSGHSLYLLNNHWKSGASNPLMESIRIQNAHVVRAELDKILFQDPDAAIIVGGDLNSHYNHDQIFPELPETAVNDILKSSPNPQSVFGGNGRSLFNLWMELPKERRGSDFYRGKWGTLMQILISQSLLDRSGLVYESGSFERLEIPGKNVTDSFGIPVAWNSFGDGGGYSDHLPIYAFFTVADDSVSFGQMIELEAMDPYDSYQLAVDFTLKTKRAYPPASILENKSDSELLEFFGQLFTIEAEVQGVDPFQVRVGDREFGIYMPLRSTREITEAKWPSSKSGRFIGELGSYRGQIQWVIRADNWILD